MSLYNKKENSLSFVLMKIEECIQLANTAKKMKIVVDKLYEATKYIAELQKLEEKGFYKGKPKAKDYVLAFTNQKEKILLEGVSRCYKAGESKEEILKNQKFFSDDVKKSVEQLPSSDL
jgi:hypothetical protein